MEKEWDPWHKWPLSRVFCCIRHFHRCVVEEANDAPCSLFEGSSTLWHSERMCLVAREIQNMTRGAISLSERNVTEVVALLMVCSRSTVVYTEWRWSLFPTVDVLNLKILRLRSLIQSCNSLGSPENWKNQKKRGVIWPSTSMSPGRIAHSGFSIVCKRNNFL